MMGRAAGVTGPIARAVMKSIRDDLADEEEGMRPVYACGAFWLDDVWLNDVIPDAAWCAHLDAVLRDEQIKGRQS